MVWQKRLLDTATLHNATAPFYNAMNECACAGMLQWATVESDEGMLPQDAADEYIPQCFNDLQQNFRVKITDLEEKLGRIVDLLPCRLLCAVRTPISILHDVYCMCALRGHCSLASCLFNES